ncbi:cytochrome c family protein [Candidatus Uabimicrobium amorphum]|uniref:Cytochrome c554 n=1 Tax=Uabimicrobium amorphum TaxID=2596890 RepID=A0A5S9IUJ7_UABAM|nr:cytochrome c family protein [Candidatus Uabimicrobium amorphum]BBM86845.1 cytochrome c554 [Candidatus Uabimicrobium amorphum]
MKLYTLLFINLFIFAIFAFSQENYLYISDIEVSSKNKKGKKWDSLLGKPDIILHVDIWQENRWTNVFVSKKYQDSVKIDEVLETQVSILLDQKIRMTLFDIDMSNNDLIGQYEFTVSKTTILGKKQNVDFDNVKKLVYYTLPYSHKNNKSLYKNFSEISLLKKKKEKQQKIIQRQKQEIQRLKKKLESIDRVINQVIEELGIGDEDIYKNISKYKAEQKKLAKQEKLEKMTKERKKTWQKILQITRSLKLSKNELEQMRSNFDRKRRPTNYKKIVTADKCSECHRKETAQWKKTPHYKTKWMPLRANAKQISKKLGLMGSIKRSGRCVKCHFTQQEQRGKPKAVSGVSCESCHGEGKDWLYIHNNFDIPRKKRLESAAKKGMGNTLDIYNIAQKCYACHSVLDEELVNKGGHRAGSRNFEFVSWSQGMERHNFVRSRNAQNAETTKQRLRVMFVVGAMLDLEYALRGIAKATQKGIYFTNAMERAKIGYRRLVALQNKADIHEISELLKLFKKLSLRPGNHEQLLAGANLIILKAKKFTKNHDGSKLESLDAIIPKNYK